MADTQEARLACIKLAAETMKGCTSKEIVAAAKDFSDFVCNVQTGEGEIA